MAVDFLTIPSSTAETERQFNSAGAMDSPRKSRTSCYVFCCLPMHKVVVQGGNISAKVAARTPRQDR